MHIIYNMGSYYRPVNKRLSNALVEGEDNDVDRFDCNNGSHAAINHFCAYCSQRIL